MTKQNDTIPEGLQTFGRELAVLAKRHGLMAMHGEFRGGLDSAWHTPVTFTWRAGRHGEDAYTISLQSVVTTVVKVNV